MSSDSIMREKLRKSPSVLPTQTWLEEAQGPVEEVILSPPKLVSSHLFDENEPYQSASSFSLCSERKMQAALPQTCDFKGGCNITILVEN